MPMIEVDEVQLQADRKLRTTVENWFKNPKARRKILEAQKLINPEEKIPELDEPDPIEAIRKESADQIAALTAQIAKDKEDRTRDQRIQELQNLKTAGIAQLKKERWTEDGIKAIEAIMESKGILDPLDAAAIFLRDHPPQQPIEQTGSGGWNFIPGAELSPSADADDKYVDALLKTKGGTEALLSQRTAQTLNEVRQARR